MASRDHLTRVHDSCSHDHGHGTTASEFIPKGEKIFNEIPVYTVNFDIIKRPQSADEENYVLNEMRKLPHHVFQQIMQMRNQLPQCLDNGRYVATPVSGTIRSNLIPLALGRYQDRADELGVFFRMSMLNHSCRPNATQTWNEELGEVTLYALEDIQQGEPITISYSPEARIDPAWVGKTYRFNCSCKWCLMGNSPTKKASEVNRADIEILGDEFEKIEDPDKALANCYHRVSLIQQEGVCDWRKGLAYEDALDLMTEEFKDSERGKVLAVLAFLAYWRCEGWDTAKGTELGAKLASLYYGMDPPTGKVYLFEMVERYIKDQDRGLIQGHIGLRGRTPVGGNGEGSSARREDHVIGWIETQVRGVRGNTPGSGILPSIEDDFMGGEGVLMRGGGPPSRGKKTSNLRSPFGSEAGGKKLRPLLPKPPTPTPPQSNVTYGQHPFGLTNFSRLADGAEERPEATNAGGVGPYQVNMPSLGHALPQKSPAYVATPTHTPAKPDVGSGENRMESVAHILVSIGGGEVVTMAASEEKGEKLTPIATQPPVLLSTESDVTNEAIVLGNSPRGEVGSEQGKQVAARARSRSKQGRTPMQSNTLLHMGFSKGKEGENPRVETQGPVQSPLKSVARVKSLSTLLPPPKPRARKVPAAQSSAPQPSAPRPSATQLFTPTPSGPQPFAVQPPPPGSKDDTPAKKRGRPRKNTDSTISESASPPRAYTHTTPTQPQGRGRGGAPSPDDGNLDDFIRNIQNKKQKTGKSPAKSPANKVTKATKSLAKTPTKAKHPRTKKSPYAGPSTPATIPSSLPHPQQPKKPSFDTEKVWEQLNAAYHVKMLILVKMHSNASGLVVGQILIVRREKRTYSSKKYRV
ncbi:uncharacterized protein PAC_11144 [Phialocephala subalpina]|uniref:SET domain-containing protein n=1 Tax=Phialocephala subalpina TaxID=576137 RepID=A0A1L7X8A8_9HELO|nr:uncharacterized protein PAC_11144 [Phialocephala subalpina]